MTWYFAVPAGPAESWKDRARAAAEQARPENATDEEIAAAIELYAGHGISERDAATVRVDPVTED